MERWFSKWFKSPLKVGIAKGLSACWVSNSSFAMTTIEEMPVWFTSECKVAVSLCNFPVKVDISIRGSLSDDDFRLVGTPAIEVASRRDAHNADKAGVTRLNNPLQWSLCSWISVSHHDLIIWCESTVHKALARDAPESITHSRYKDGDCLGYRCW